jgi:membrane protease YdiL (CAAX protease family)
MTAAADKTVVCPRFSLCWKVALAVALEFAYAIGTRVGLKQFYEGIELELYTTAIRLASAGIYWLMFRDLLRSRVPQLSSTRQPLFALGIVLVALVPVLVGDWDLDGLATRTVFAATSIAVGLREEIVYRGVLQNLLERRTHWLAAIVVSNILFTLYHYGAWPFTPDYVVEFLLVGGAMGLIYAGTGSLWLTIAAHSIYDALWSFTPILTPPLAKGWGMGLEALAFAFLAFWAWRTRTARTIPS